MNSPLAPAVQTETTPALSASPTRPPTANETPAWVARVVAVPAAHFTSVTVNTPEALS